MYPSISIVTPAYNSAATIDDTLASIAGQGYPNLEHIVIDGGSSDETAQIVARYPGTKWVSEKDEGLYDAMNKGIALARGEIIAILNSDDCFRPNALHVVGRMFQQNPTWQAAFGNVVFVDVAGEELYRREEAGFDYTVLRCWRNYICHQTLFVKKSIYENLGGYEHRKYRYCADYEFLLRMGRAGVVVGHIPEFLVNFRYHQKGASGSARVAEQMFKEFSQIRAAYGIPSLLQPFASVYGRALRQFQKLWYLRKCDVIPGDWFLRKFRGNNR